MGYYIRPGLLTENKDILSPILAAADTGKEVRFDIPDRAQIGRMQYHFNRVLKATEMLRDEEGGIYTDLRERVTVSVDAKRSQLVVRPKGEASEHVPSERDALEALQSYSGSLTTVEFALAPDFSLEQFEIRAKALGWRLYRESMKEYERNGREFIRVAAERLGPDFDRVTNAEPSSEREAESLDDIFDQLGG